LTVESIWWAKEIGTNDTAKRELTKLFSGIAVFDTPKPDTLLARILRIGSDKRSCRLLR
jgi:adenine-specific DNA-methyltransferase